MRAMHRLKIHSIALVVVFILSTIMGLAYTTFWYESRERYLSKTRRECLEKMEALEERRADARESELAAVEESIRGERETLAALERTAVNTWSSRIWCGLLYWWPWILLTPAILELCRLFPFRRGGVVVASLVHIFGGFGFGAAKILIEGFALQQMFDASGKFIGMGSVFIACSTYWFMVVAFIGIEYYKRFREREIRASRLESQLAKAQLQLLQMQIRPHFLFNTLHAISTLMIRDVRAAERMITRLSDFLRISLSHIDQQEVPLHEELDFLKCYLDIEQVRFGDRLVWNKEVEPRALEALVPNLILQPIVENAVKHGSSRIDTTGRIRLRAATCNGSLLIAVSDNGPGFSNLDATADAHVGLANTRARLKRLYGSKGGIEFQSPSEGGLVVRMEIPFHTRPVSKLKKGDSS